MKKRPIFLTIILWAETILSARVLVFTFPVLISKFEHGTVRIASISDWTIFTLTIIAIYYFVTGLASILNLRGWKIFHYLGVVLTLALSAGLIKKVITVYTTASFALFIPAILSILLAVAVLLAKEEKPMAH